MMAMTALSCVHKNDLEHSGQKMRFTATFAENGTPVRTNPSLSGDVINVLWEAGDRVGVYAADGAPELFTADSDGVTTELSGDPVSGDGVFYAMYPYDQTAVIAGKQITTSLPAVQYALKNDFTSHLAVASTTEETMNFKFRNVFALMEIFVGYSGLTKVVFQGNNQEIVAGDITVNAANATYVNGADVSTAVTLLPPVGNSTFEMGTFFFSVLPQTFQRGFRITAYKESDQVFDVRVVNEPTHLNRSNFVQAAAFAEAGAVVPGENGIRIPEQLISFAKVANQGGDISSYCNASGHVVLLDDIQLPDIEWTPIGNATDMKYNQLAVVDSAFTCVFDGQGHTISGLRLAPAGAGVNTSGFFGATNNSVIRNVNFDDVQMNVNCVTGVSAGHLAIGTVVGYALDTKVENVSVNAQFTGATVSTDKLNISIAGIVGIMAATAPDKSHITGCTFGGSVTTDIGAQYTNNNSASVGGILGSVYLHQNSLVKISDCTNNATINVKSHRAAGIAAAAAYTQIENCVNNGDITANYSSNWTSGQYATGKPVRGVRMGGIIGYNQVDEENESYIWNCVNRGTITSSQPASAVGGVAGLLRSTEIKGCKNSGNVYASDQEVSYVLDDVPGTLPAGRGLLVGQIQSGIPVKFTDCYICGQIGTSPADAVASTSQNYLNTKVGACFIEGDDRNWTSSNVHFWSNPE